MTLLVSPYCCGCRDQTKLQEHANKLFEYEYTVSEQRIPFQSLIDKHVKGKRSAKASGFVSESGSETGRSLSSALALSQNCRCIARLYDGIMLNGHVLYDWQLLNFEYR